MSFTQEYQKKLTTADEAVKVSKIQEIVWNMDGVLLLQLL